MSHEIRTPLNALLGLSELLKEGPLTPGQQADVEALGTAGQHLLALVSDVRDFSRIEAGRLTLEEDVFSLPALLAELRALFRVRARQSGLSLTLTAGDGLPPLWRGDANRLRQCLVNYLGNALEFTEHGYVRLTVTPTGRSEGTQTLRFTVSDSGPGISPEDQRNLFQPFVRPGAGTTDRQGGAGLGLSIVKGLVQAMGGRVGVDSEVGKGSHLWLEVPLGLAVPGGAGTGPGIAPGQVGLNIGYVTEDPAVGRRLLELSRRFGWQATCHRPDAALAQSAAGADLLVFAEADSGRGALPAALASRVIRLDDLRPIDEAHLFNQVNEAFVQRGHAYDDVLKRSLLPRGESRWLSGANLLIVDDAPLNLEVLGRILDQEGAATTRCLSGEAALAALREAPDAYDAVLMDMQMPGLDGCETTLQIRQRLQLRVPVIAVTAGATTTERERAMRCGMDDFLTKPVTVERLVRAVRTRMESSRQRTLRLVPRPPAPPTEPRPQATDLGHVVDLADLERRFDGDLGLLPDMLGLLLNDTRDASATAGAFLAAGDLAPLARYAHLQAGQFANIGAATVVAAAGALEKSAKADSPAEAEQAFQAFEAAHRTFLEVATRWLAEQRSQ